MSLESHGSRILGQIRAKVFEFRKNTSNSKNSFCYLEEEGPMTMPRFARSWILLSLLVGAATVTFGACSKEEDDGSGTGGNGSGSSPSGTGSKTSTGSGTGSTASATGGNAGTAGAPSNSSGGAATSTTKPPTNVAACQGIPTTPDKIGSLDEVCTPQSEESEPIPADMVILMDRSISNSYAVGSNTATPATNGQLTRWDVLTAGMEALSTAAGDIGASLTFFSLNGSTNSATECNPKDYEVPVVPFATLAENGAEMVAKMKALSPSGLTPTVPALQGALTYAMKLRAADQSREKVVVMISDGYPTICDARTAPDVTAVIKEAMAAPIPIRTFVVGIGSPASMSMAKLNLMTYAVAGGTKTPILLDETAGADGVRAQLENALRNISEQPLACEYKLTPAEGTIIDPERITVTFQPAVGQFQEIPRVAGATGCDKSTNGGWYFDNPVNPTKVTMCPCTCSAFGAGTVNLVYNCKPLLVIQ